MSHSAVHHHYGNSKVNLQRLIADNVQSNSDRCELRGCCFVEMYLVSLKLYWHKHRAQTANKVQWNFTILQSLVPLRRERQSIIFQCVDIQTCASVCVCVYTVCDLEKRCRREEKYIPAGYGVSVCTSSWERECAHVCICASACMCVCVCRKRKSTEREVKLRCVFCYHLSQIWSWLHAIPGKASTPLLSWVVFVRNTGLEEQHCISLPY